MYSGAITIKRSTVAGFFSGNTDAAAVRGMTDGDLDLLENNLKVYIRQGGARLMGGRPGATRRSCQRMIAVAELQAVLGLVHDEMNRRANA